MSKIIQKTLLWVGVVGLVLLVIYSLKQSNKESDLLIDKDGSSSGVVMEEYQPVTSTPGKKMAFSQFVKQGGSYKCDVKQYMSDMENTGTVYVSGGNIRGEYTTVAEGQTMQTSFLMRDGYSYTWSSMMPSMGFKMKVVTDTTGNTGADTSGTYSWNADQIGDYNCEAWIADQLKFTIPAGITFKEMGSQ